MKQSKINKMNHSYEVNTLAMIPDKGGIETEKKFGNLIKIYQSLTGMSHQMAINSVKGDMN